MDRIFLFCCLCAVMDKMLTGTIAQTFKRGGVSSQEKEAVVKVHNELRLKLANKEVPNQPRAINMKEMCWDDRLAQEAQKIADKVQFKHQDVKDDRWPVGQNLYLHMWGEENDKPDWNLAISKWFNEVLNYKYGDTFSKNTGHYTQVVWAKSYRVGCGYAYFVDETQTLKYRQLYVCNYGPGGNIKGQAPYKTGKCGCEGLCKTRWCRKGKISQRKRGSRQVSERADDLFSVIYKFLFE